MALRGQLLELKNTGRYIYDLVIGISDNALPEQLSIDLATEDGGHGDNGNEALSADSVSTRYECRLDLSNRSNPISFPMGDLLTCMEIYHANETPLGLPADDGQKWQIAYIIDTIITELISTDALEVIYGDEWEMASLVSEADDEKIFASGVADQNIPSPRALNLGRGVNSTKCPDCGAPVKAAVKTPDAEKQILTCLACGRQFG